MNDDSLRTLLEQHGLGAYLAEFQEHGVDAMALGALTPAHCEQLAKKLGMRFGDEAKLQRLCEEQRAKPASTLPPLDPPLEQDLLDHLPTPIARAARRISVAVDPVHFAIALETLIDTLLRFLALVCQADYLSAANWHDPALNARFKKLERPAPGDWWTFINDSIAGAKRSEHPLFLAELRDTWKRSEHSRPVPNAGEVWDEVGRLKQWQDNVGTLEWLINRRNAYVHTKIARQDEAPALQGREVAVLAIREYQWLGKYELWVSDGAGMALLRGRVGRVETDGPFKDRRSKGVALRRRSPDAPGGHRTLELPPLIVSEAMIAEALAAKGGDGATALLYGEIRSDREIHYSGPDVKGVVRSRATDRHLDDLRRLQQAKNFPRLDRNALTPADLLARTWSATNLTLDILEATQKYRRKLHVERTEYEPRLAAWIDSPVPLLGIAAEAGAGKTGIFASLVYRWRKPSGKPVLLLLAREFQEVATIDRVICNSLFLDDDLAATDVADVLEGLVVVVDGLNEHPRRIDLLDGIRNLARAGLQTGRGPRFAISWRTEDEEWMQSALSERRLWWTPPSSTAMQQLDEWLSARDEDEDGEASGAQGPEDGAGRRSGAGEMSPDRGDAAAFVTIKAFTDAEVGSAWDLYRTHEPQRMKPRFDWAELQKKSPELSWDLHNPLRMRIAMECYHNKKLPKYPQVEQVFGTYLDILRSAIPGDSVRELLALLGEMMFADRRTRFLKSDLEEKRYALVYDGDLPAFDFLVRRGVLSVLDEQGRTAFTFTVERVAEQVLGEHVAMLPEAATAEGLAGLSDELHESGFMLGAGAIRVALRLRVAERGNDFLYEFIDAHPAGVGRLAAGILAGLVVSKGEADASSFAEKLLDDPTDAHFEVAAEVAVQFIRRGRFAIEHAFLQPFVASDHRHRLEASTTAALLAVRYIGVALRSAGFATDETTAADFDPKTDETIGSLLAALRVLAATPGLEDASVPLCGALQLIGQWQMRQRRFDAATRYFQQWVEIARSAGGARPNAKQRRSLAVALENLGDALREAGRHDEALQAYREAIGTGMHPERCKDWSPASVWAKIAKVHKSREHWSEALEAETACLEASRAEGDTSSACSAASRIGDLYAKRGDPAAGIEWKRCAVAIARGGDARWDVSGHLFHAGWWDLPIAIDELITALREAGRHHEAIEIDLKLRCCDVAIAREGGDRRHVALSLERLGDALRKAGRHDEAIEAYREAIETGMHPTRCEQWSPSRAWIEIANLQTAREDWSKAIETETADLEASRAEGDTGNACRAASRIGTLHAKLGDPAAGIEWQRRAVAIARGSDDRRVVALSLKWLGDALREAGRHDEALKAYREAIDTGMNPTRCEKWSPASVWIDIAKVHKSRQAWSELIEAETACLEGHLEDGDTGNACLVAIRIGTLHAKLGDPAAGIEWQRCAVAIARGSDDRRVVVRSLERLGDALREAGRHDEAIEAYREAIETGMHPERCAEWSPASVWATIAEVHEARKDWSEAIEAATAEFEVRLEDGCPITCRIAAHIGDLHAKRGDPAAGIEWQRRAVAIAQGSHEAWESLEWLGDALRDSGRYDEAIEAYREAIEACERLAAHPLHVERVERLRARIAAMNQ